MAALNNASVQQQNQQQQQQQQQKDKSRASSQSPGTSTGARGRSASSRSSSTSGNASSSSSSSSNGRRRNCPFSHCDTNTWSHTGAKPPPAVVIESGSSGVHSTVQLNKPTPTSPPSEHLQLQLPRPMHNPNTTDDPLTELDAIEEKLCSLLSTASAAIRIMGGGVNGSEESSGSGDDVVALKPTVKEFMVGVAEVQAGLRWQHAQLVRSRIPVRAQAAFQSDVAGVERDLVLWEDVARLLADAVDEGLAISAAAATESSA
ncbi:hypothetical protein LPJ66_011444 [Kickxella alabastrina]|uniref:Uncharacterized protein n=1 Tax=Kickxella alabastrina TaxID=61397 RepID=A0ACC1I1F9_9FUNG|nr:hypothetical protein LPJ66_011444 [Kickxella alabastrina]